MHDLIHLLYRLIHLLYRLIHLLYHYIRQRSWANVMYSSPFVCLFVCLLAGLLKKLWTDLNEI